MRLKLVLAAILFSLVSRGVYADSNFCKVTGENLLRDPEFAQRNLAGYLEFWASSQHAGEPSFDLIFDDELTIIKTGTQPWFYFRQYVQAEQLAGKKLALNADLKLDLRYPEGTAGRNVGGGVKIVARSSGERGRKLLLRSILDHQPHIGSTDWFPVQVVVQLPEKTSRIDVGFLHQADGSLQIRKPSFQLVDESAAPCEVSPNAILGVPRAVSGLR